MLHSQLIDQIGGTDGLIKNPCIWDGNKRIGVHALLVSLVLQKIKECIGMDIHKIYQEEFATALSGHMKYIFVNQNGSYTIGYDDGNVFGGHEINVDVNSKGKMVCADIR